VGSLVLLSLVLITLSFRQEDDGPIASARSAAARVVQPFQVAADRVAEPFRDAHAWFDGVLGARSEAERLQRENDELRQQLARNDVAAAENESLRSLLEYRDGPRFPDDFEGVAAQVVSRTSGAFAQAVVIAAGTKDGVRVDDPVVDGRGLVGTVTRVSSRTARVTLLTDEQSAVSAVDVRSQAAGIVRHGRGARMTLILDRVPKHESIEPGDTIVTAGWRTPQLASRYPKGIQIGRVTSVGRADTDLYTQVQVEPFVDFGDLESVLVLVRRAEATP
jgi:rod shape-determining protein MreC